MPVNAVSSLRGHRSIQDESETLQERGFAGPLATDEGVETITQRNPGLRDEGSDDVETEYSGVSGLRSIQRHPMPEGESGSEICE
jgi:hypothetical protein